MTDPLKHFTVKMYRKGGEGFWHAVVDVDAFYTVGQFENVAAKAMYDFKNYTANTELKLVELNSFEMDFGYSLHKDHNLRKITLVVRYGAMILYSCEVEESQAQSESYSVTELPEASSYITCLAEKLKDLITSIYEQIASGIDP